MSRKEHRIKNHNNQNEEVELLEETKEKEQHTKLNNEMLKLEEEISTLTENNKVLEEKVRMAQAELVNYRKRKDEETANSLKYANQDIIKDLLNTIDNFERALENKNVSDEVSKYLNGFQMIYENLKATLKSYGVEEINRVGEVFDPNLEQALVAECVEDKDDDIVLEVLLKGYKLKDRVIRPASVKINQK